MHAKPQSSIAAKRGWPGYNTIWRWHFYAGLFCIPFIFVLTITGAIYLFNPQYEAHANSAYDHLAMTGARASAEAQVRAALAEVPGSVLNSYELPETPQAAARVFVGNGEQKFLVYVHPETLEVLRREEEDWRFMKVVHRIHGELLIGDRGSNIVELAASWAIVMFITGLYLWWPRNGNGWAGIVYPRLHRGSRMFWRDLHAVTGLWISFFVLFLLISGLPWAKSWGGLLKEVRQLGAHEVVRQDWTTGRSSELADRKQMNTPAAMGDEHAGHMQHHAGGMPHAGYDYSPLDRLIATVQPLNLAPPVRISPPSGKSPDWTARSDAQNRPLRVNLVLDADTGAIKSRKDFADRPLLDRIIGYGVAAHEGQLFGWFNQALGVFTALGLLLMLASSVVLWWRRRTPGTLGAPKANSNVPRFSFALIGAIVILGVLLPFLGITMLAVLLIERWVLRYIPSAREFLGLNARNA
ncbi:MAG: PepSY domain-containing protein [Nitrosomonadales bacterium]|nr:PepSY domain-containing protein [Nitrosomonadales bacterium]